MTSPTKEAIERLRESQIQTWTGHALIPHADLAIFLASHDKLVEEIKSIRDDCEAEYPPSHGAIRQSCLALLKELGQ